MSFDYAIHSDFLIHWTGKDIEDHDPYMEDGQPNSNHWYYQRDKRDNEKEIYSKTNPALAEKYLKRLNDILTYGLWMTSEPEITERNRVVFPATPKCCFTELKISESRRHAKQYGRLGIGFKRPFLFGRAGRPVAYYGFRGDSKDSFLEECARDLENKDMLNFFKPMNSRRKLDYDLYSESEWRIIYLKELLSAKKIVDPRDEKNEKEHKYFNSLSEENQKKLKYLIPLDGWVSMIIYPSLEIKNKAQQEDKYEIFSKMHEIKSNEKDLANTVEGKNHGTSQGNWPIEIDLDACRNF